MKMFVNFHMFCTLVYLRIVCISLSSVVKRFEFLKALYKFPIIIISSNFFRFSSSRVPSQYFSSHSLSSNATQVASICLFDFAQN